jgi:hypothetical protein
MPKVESATPRVIEPEIADLLAKLKRRLEGRFGDRFGVLLSVRLARGVITSPTATSTSRWCSRDGSRSVRSR